MGKKEGRTERRDRGREEDRQRKKSTGKEGEKRMDGENVIVVQMWGWNAGSWGYIPYFPSMHQLTASLLRKLLVISET